MPLSNGKLWTLGFVEELGGAQVRRKRTFGVCVPFDSSDEEDNLLEEEVHWVRCAEYHIITRLCPGIFLFELCLFIKKKDILI